MSNELEVKKTLDEIAGNVAQFQDTLKKTNGAMTENLSKLANETALKLEGMQKSIEEEKAYRQMLEKQISRPSGNSEFNSDDKEIKKAMNTYLKKGIAINDEVKHKLANKIAENYFSAENPEFIMAKKQEMFSSMIGNDPSNGYLVRPEYSNTILKRIFETSPIRSIATVLTVSGKSINFLIDDQEFESGGWVSEIETRNNTSNGSVGQIEIMNFDQYAEPKATQEFLDDAMIDVESWILGKITDSLTRKENEAFVKGNGAGKPKGFLSYDAWATAGTYERNKIEQIVSSKSADFDADDVITLQNSLLEDYQGNGTFVMNRSAFTKCMQLKSGTGTYLINPYSIAEGVDKIMLGKKVIFASDMPQVGSNALAIAYGDFRKGYTITDRMDIRILRDNLTTKPYVKFYATKRVGGGVTDFSAIKILKILA